MTIGILILIIVLGTITTKWYISKPKVRTVMYEVTDKYMWDTSKKAVMKRGVLVNGVLANSADQEVFVGDTIQYRDKVWKVEA